MCALLQTRYFFLPHDYRQIFVAPKQIVSSHAKEKKGKKKKSFGIFETSLTIKTIKTTQGRKGTKNFSCFSELFLKTPLLEKKVVTMLMFSVLVLLFARLIESSIIAVPLLPRLAVSLYCRLLVKIINMEKISVEPLYLLGSLVFRNAKSAEKLN